MIDPDLDKLNQKVEEAFNEVKQTVQMVMARGDSLVDMLKKADELELNSKAFNCTTTKVKTKLTDKLKAKYLKRILIIYLVTLIFCLFTFLFGLMIYLNY